MAVRIAIVDSVQVLQQPVSTPLNVDSAAIDCTAYPTARYLLSVFFAITDIGTPVTINSWVFDPTGTNQSLTQIADAGTDERLRTARKINPASANAIVRLNAESSTGTFWNGILATMLLYEVDQTVPEGLISNYTGADLDHITTEASFEPNHMHLAIVGVETASTSDAIAKFQTHDGSFPFIISTQDFIDAGGFSVLALMIAAQNGDQYADRQIFIGWEESRTFYWATDLRVADHKQLHVDIPGAASLPGHIVPI